MTVELHCHCREDIGYKCPLHNKGAEMTDDLVKRLRGEAADWDEPKHSDEVDVRGMLYSSADRIEALTAENERLREAFDAVWKQATTMRNASKLVSPYPDDHAKRSIWVRSLYHEGKRLHELLKPTRAALGDTQ